MEKRKVMNQAQLEAVDYLVVSDGSVITVNDESEQDRTSHFADLIRYHVLENQEHCKLVLKTVDKEPLLRELLFKLSGVSAAVFNEEKINDRAWMQLLDATEAVAKMPLEIIETGNT